jgi:dTDP-4-amino-4,6-dideoxygalactose transaminase
MRVPFVDLQTQFESLRPEIEAGMLEVLTTASFIHGKHVHAFEEDFAHYLGARHAIGVGNGTDALYLALRASGIGPGDEVITAANTFIATTEAITGTGATIVLVDVDPVTYTLDPNLVEEAITSRTKAIIPVHLYGQPADMDAIMAIADRHGLLVIEDACQSHGAWYDGERTGTIGHIGCFSCYPGKNLGAYGDAGVMVTNDDALAARLRMLANHGSAQKYHHEIEGWNSRLDTIQAAVLGVKLPYLDQWNHLRREHAARYSELLANSGVTTPSVRNSDHVWHLYVIETANRDELAAQLRERGIATGVHYPVPLHLQPAYRHLEYGIGSFPVTERAAARILSLPMFPELTASQIEYVAGAVHEIVAAPVAA